MSRAERAARLPLHVRLVPFWVVASGSLGCLADPPTFAPRGQIPPFIIAGQVDPPIGSIYEGDRNFQISVPFRSEDVNKGLSAGLFLDLVPGATRAEEVVAFDDVPPGRYEEVRLLTMGGIIQRTGTCHSVTLIVTYNENLDRQRGNLPLNEALAARLVWWLNINDPDGETRMAECPGANQADAVPSGG